MEITTRQWRIPTAAFVLVIVTLFHQCVSAEADTKYNITKKEEAAIQEFREVVKDALYADFMSRDGYLIHWIRDSQFDLKSASQKLRKSIEWRKRTKMDKLFQDPVHQKLNETYPILSSGFDRTGFPVVTIDLGIWAIRKLTLQGMQPALTRHLLSAAELGLLRNTEIQGNSENVFKFALLVDLAGFNLREHVCLACLPVYTEAVLNYEANYPGLMNLLFVFNAPKISETISQIVKPIMTPETRDIFKIYGVNKQEWQKALLERVSPEQLTTRFGGIRKISHI